MTLGNRSFNRRDAIKASLAAGSLPFLSRQVMGAGRLRTRPIPSSGESLPVVGLGTSGVFDTGSTESELEPRREIISLMREYGASVIDTSPMYGNAENVVGITLRDLGARDSVFLATKVWTEGKAAGISQMRRSFELLRTDVIDLMQVHNLVDLETQLASVRSLKEAGSIRYTGITHYRVSAHESLMRVMRKEPLDFIQLNYSILTRDAEQTVLPLARDRGVAVIVNRAFEDGALFARVRGKPLPDWAKEIDIESWGQYFLKYVLGHPAVTVTIPGTSKPKHMLDNLGAGLGHLPDERDRQRMVSYLESI